MNNLDASKIAAKRDRTRTIMAEQRARVEKKPLTFLWRFKREIKQRNRTAVVRGKKGEDDASSPRAVVSFEYKGIHISTRRKKRGEREEARK